MGRLHNMGTSPNTTAIYVRRSAFGMWAMNRAKSTPMTAAGSGLSRCRAVASPSSGIGGLILPPAVGRNFRWSSGRASFSVTPPVLPMRFVGGRWRCSPSLPVFPVPDGHHRVGRGVPGRVHLHRGRMTGFGIAGVEQFGPQQPGSQSS